jgi:hypothetical protein
MCRPVGSLVSARRKQLDKAGLKAEKRSLQCALPDDDEGR